jgi:hypothetical protein
VSSEYYCLGNNTQMTRFTVEHTARASVPSRTEALVFFMCVKGRDGFSIYCLAGQKAAATQARANAKSGEFLLLYRK